MHHQELATVLLNYHIGLLFSVRCVLAIWCSWFLVLSVLQNTDSTWSALCPTHNTTEEKSLQYHMSV